MTNGVFKAYVVSCSHDVEEGIDADLTLAPIKYCVDSAVCGSILVFLPGNEDILATPRWRRRHSDAGTSVRTSLPDGPRGPTANSTPSGHRKVVSYIAGERELPLVMHACTNETILRS